MNQHTGMGQAAQFEASAVVAEQQLLGAVMQDNAVFDLVSDLLAPEHFIDPLHGKIFEICGKRITKGHLASAVAMGAILADDDGLKQLGGAGYLIRMAGSALSSRMARDYAKMIVEQAVRRRLNQAAQTAIADLSSGGEAADVKMGLLHALQALPEASGEESSVSFLKAVTKAVDGAVQSYGGEQSFLKTGVPALDSVVRGLGPGDYMLLGGATSMGKTSLAVEIAGNVAIDQGKRVCFWSLEMQDDQLATRMISARSRVPYADLRDAGDMAEADFRRWMEASQAISQASLRIIPKHIRDIAAGHAATRRVKREFGGVLDLLLIDYAQLIRGTGKSRFEQMTEVSIAIKTMAGMLECPVIALVQLSRDIGQREDKRPQLSDIKESGQFENDADQVVFCHRESYWMERQGPKLDKSGNITDQAKLEFDADLASVRNIMEIIVRKNRHGRLATAQVGFHAPTNKFWKLGEHSETQEQLF